MTWQSVSWAACGISDVCPPPALEGSGIHVSLRLSKDPPWKARGPDRPPAAFEAEDPHPCLLVAWRSQRALWRSPDKCFSDFRVFLEKPMGPLWHLECLVIIGFAFAIVF